MLNKGGWKMEKELKTAFMGIRIKPSQYETLQAVAQNNNTTVSKLVISMIDQALINLETIYNETKIQRL